MKKQNLFLVFLFFLLSFGNSLYGQKENKHRSSVSCLLSAQSYTQIFSDEFQHVTLNGEKVVNFVKHSIRTDSTDKYTFSAGLNYSFVGGGPSIKYGIAQNCVFQTDLVGKFFINQMSFGNGFIVYIHEISQNFLYQRKFSEKNDVAYYYMIGGGLSGGVSLFRPLLWKIGTYPFFGVEFALKNKKLSFQIDVRPGYGLLLKSGKAKPSRIYDDTLQFLYKFLFYVNPPEQFPYHGYDISVNFAVRFCKIK